LCACVYLHGMSKDTATSTRFAIIDVETTGGGGAFDRITEIAIVLHNGECEIERFHSLVNPEQPIPYFIQKLTGITDDTVADAPKFYEIARKIVEITTDAIFVAHNVKFDYHVVRGEFRNLGYEFERKQLCTVKLARKIFPGLASYSLGALVKHFHIPHPRAHRALDDTLATVHLFQLLLQNNPSPQNFATPDNLREAKLPPHIALDTIRSIPEACGVYYFYNTLGDIIYIGKSINIRKRVLQHFNGKTDKAQNIQGFVHSIQWQLTGNELIALLHEADEIKHHQPPFNRALKQKNFPYVIHQTIHPLGYTCLQVARKSAKLHTIADFANLDSAKTTLRNLAHQYAFCPDITEAKRTTDGCLHYQLGLCAGACAAIPPVASYNEQVQQAINSIQITFNRNMLLLGKGRTPDERTVVLIQDGHYQGFGYIPNPDIQQLQLLKNAISPRPHTLEVARILATYIKNNKDQTILYLD
jgi:DNA polymerase-3 subunit epsilon